MNETPVNTPNPDAPPIKTDEPRRLLAACANCMFFHERDMPEDHKGPIFGECRRKSPKADSRGGAQWVTTHGGLWCGEHPLLQSILESQVRETQPRDSAIIRGLRLARPEEIRKAEERVEEKGDAN